MKTLANSATLLGVALVSAGAAHAQTTLRLGHNQVEEHTYHVTAQYFADKVEEISGGDVQINIIPNGALGQEASLLQSVASGNLDMSISTAANASGFVPELGFLSVSYLFADGDHFTRTISDDDFNASLDSMIENRDPGFQRVATMTPGARSVYTTFGPVESLDDIEGEKIRVMSSPVESQVWSRLGALPVAIPFGDIYTGMQTGLIVAAENSPGSYALNKHNEVAPYFSVTEHQWPISLIFVSDAAWERLDEDQRAAVTEAGRVTAEFAATSTIESDNALLESMSVKYGVKVNRPDTAPFRERLLDFQDAKAEELDVIPVLERIRAMQ